MLRKLLVPDQNANNTLKLYESESPCCGDGQADCQSTATFATSGTLTAITIKESDGTTNKVIAVTSTAAATAKATAAAIRAALATAGYEENDDNSFKGVDVSLVSTNTQVVITGDIKVVSLTHSGGTASAAVECTRRDLCTYSLVGSAGGATNNLHIDGVDYALGAIVPGTTSAGTVQTAVAAALTSAGVTGTAAVATTGSGGGTLYNVTLTNVGNDHTFVLNGVHFDRSACVANWV